MNIALNIARALGVTATCPRFTRRPPRRRATIGALLLGVLLPTAGHAHDGVEQRIAALRTEIAAAPTDGGLHVRLAEVYGEHAQWNELLAEAALAESLAPGKFAVAVVRAPALLALGRATEARADLDALLAEFPQHSRAFTWRARAFLALGNRAAALADYRAALQHSPALDLDLSQEAASEFAAGGEIDAAVATLEACLSQSGLAPALVVRLADLEADAGRIESALARLALMQTRTPRPEPWLVRRAELLARTGRSAEARATWLELQQQLDALSASDRRAHAINLIAEQTRRALAPVSEVSVPSSSTSLSVTGKPSPSIP